LFLDARVSHRHNSRVAALRGYATQQTVDELQISQITVQEHLRPRSTGSQSPAVASA
jgi:hypothetical protein